MKRSNFLILLVLLGVSASFWQCGGDPSSPPDPRDEQIKKLSKTWKIDTSDPQTSVTYNSSSQTTSYNGFQLTITGSAGQTQIPFTTTGRPAGTNNTPWPASGNFEFGSDFATLLNRTDISGGLTITYSVSDTQLQMTFDYGCPNCTPYSGSKVNSVNGTWVFSFKAVP